MRISTDLIIESEQGLQYINVTFEVDAKKWEGKAPVDKLAPAVKALRKHMPFPAYQIINVSQSILSET